MSLAGRERQNTNTSWWRWQQILSLGLMRMLCRPPHWRCFSDNIGILITRDSMAWRKGMAWRENKAKIIKGQGRLFSAFNGCQVDWFDSDRTLQGIGDAIFILTASGYVNQFIYPCSQQPSRHGSRPFLLLRRQSPDDAGQTAREARPSLARPIGAPLSFISSHQNAVVLPSIVSSVSDCVSYVGFRSGL